MGLAPGSINRIMFDSPAWRDALLGRKTAVEYWTAVGPDLGLASPEQIEQFRRRYHADESINAAVRDIIRRLHGRYKLAVLSNAPPGLDEWLVDWGMRDLFDVVVCSGEVGLMKPDPAVYRLTLRRLKVPPQEAVFIDDTVDHVAAARRIGMTGIVFTDAADLDRELNAVLTLRL
jgi:putative hydrolase of the HAD superfamily